jgi:hypothetical protein
VLTLEIVASVLVPSLLAAIGFYVRNSRQQVRDVEVRSYRRHEDAKGLVEAAEARAFQATKDAETRAIQAIKDTEARCERADARLLERVDSQYSELRKDLRDIARDVSIVARTSGQRQQES